MLRGSLHLDTLSRIMCWAPANLGQGMIHSATNCCGSCLSARTWVYLLGDMWRTQAEQNKLGACGRTWDTPPRATLCTQPQHLSQRTPTPPIHPVTQPLTHPSPCPPIHILAPPTRMTSCVSHSLCDSATGACVAGCSCRQIF